ncbi:MAG: hypothetical protein ACRCYC_15305, partial [Paraclostridium sp.]|uniref:hypothetical protein n=1 Tax=Paraclostridium sp. TaxID=2023273 RepID=UPI003F3E05AE
NLFEKLDELNINDNFKLAILKALKLNCSIKEIKNIDKNITNFLNNDDSSILDEYKKILEKKINPFIIENQNIMEHYLVNIAYTSAMPFNENKNIMNGYLYIVIQYAMLKMYLGFIESDKITKDDFVKVVTLTSRTLNHNILYKEKVETLINGTASCNGNLLARLVTLIK